MSEISGGRDTSFIGIASHSFLLIKLTDKSPTNYAGGTSD